MKKSCVLCGGKLKDGICTECGMNNRKSDEQYYRYFKEQPDRVSAKRTVSRRPEAAGGQKKTGSYQKSYQTAGQKRTYTGTGKTYEKRNSTKAVRTDRRDYEKRTKKNSRVILWIFVILAVLGAVGEGVFEALENLWEYFLYVM